MVSRVAGLLSFSSIANSKGQARGPGTDMRVSEHEREVGFFLDLFCPLLFVLLEDTEGCCVVGDLPSDLSEYFPSNCSVQNIFGQPLIYSGLGECQ